MKTHYAAAVIAALVIGGAATTFAADSSVGQKVDDVTLLTKIKADLLANKNVDGLDVNVDVKDGRVTLSGSASSEAERTKAESIAKGTKGVMSVENKIVLKNR
ncbi:MAG: BON domain-containing protein [Steroidobacteraceae bacterium]